MGLAICKRIIENSGGKIDMYSAGKGEGCTIMFTMKMSKQDDELISVTSSRDSQQLEEQKQSSR